MIDKGSEIGRLNFEDIIWCIFIITSILNIIGNDYQKKYVINEIQFYENRANDIYMFVLIVILIIYFYFFNRNYNMYKNKGDMVKVEDFIKVMGSILFIIGTLFLIYFQVKSNDNFIGGPAI